MSKVILAILRPLLVSLMLKAVKALVSVFLTAAEKWMEKKVQSTDTKYDDALFTVFKDHKDGIIDAFNRVIDHVSGNSE